MERVDPGLSSLFCSDDGAGGPRPVLTVSLDDGAGGPRPVLTVSLDDGMGGPGPVLTVLFR